MEVNEESEKAEDQPKKNTLTQKQIDSTFNQRLSRARNEFYNTHGSNNTTNIDNTDHSLKTKSKFDNSRKTDKTSKCSDTNRISDQKPSTPPKNTPGNFSTSNVFFDRNTTKKLRGIRVPQKETAHIEHQEKTEKRTVDSINKNTTRKALGRDTAKKLRTMRVVKHEDPDSENQQEIKKQPKKVEMDPISTIRQKIIDRLQAMNSTGDEQSKMEEVPCEQEIPSKQITISRSMTKKLRMVRVVKKEGDKTQEEQPEKKLQNVSTSEEISLEEIEQQNNSGQTVDIAASEFSGQQATVDIAQDYSSNMTIDLTVAVKEGLFNPTVETGTTEKPINSISWQDVLANKIIEKNRLLPIEDDIEDMDSIKIGRLLGKGANGEVYEVEYRRFHPHKYALKLPLRPLSKNEAPFSVETEQLKKIQVAKSFHIPKILTGEFYYEGTKIPYYITYLMQPIEQAFNIAEESLLYPPSAFVVWYALLKGLESLSHEYIIHNDIKPENIMFCKDVPIFVDFGVSKSYGEINQLELWKKRGYIHGTPTYLPPEVIEVKDKHILLHVDKVSQKLDVWALGLTMMEWLTGDKLFDGVPLGNNAIETLATMNQYFSAGQVKKYRDLCKRKLTRFYLGTDTLTQQRLNDYDVIQLYTGVGVQRARYEENSAVNLDQVDVKTKEKFISQLLEIFDLCTLPFDQRPKAGQLLNKINKLIPHADQKYSAQYNEASTPPLKKVFITKNSTDSYKTAALEEYIVGMQIDIVFNNFYPTINTRESSFIRSNYEDLKFLVEDIVNNNITNSEIIKKHNLTDKDAEDLLEKREALNRKPDIKIIKYQNSPFDFRFTAYHPVLHSSKNIINHMDEENLVLVLSQECRGKNFDHVLCSQTITDRAIYSDHPKRQGYLFPLCTKNNGKVEFNLSPIFISTLAEKLNLNFASEGNAQDAFNANDAFHYIYAVLYSPSYRFRYNKYLQCDFPFIPLIASQELFRKFCQLGKKLIELHTLQSSLLSDFVIPYPISGDNQIDKGYPLYRTYKIEPSRLYINKEQYFEGIAPEVWSFRIGNYQLCSRWLENHQEQKLNADDLAYYQKMIVCIHETVEIMKEIDQTVPRWPVG